MAAPLLRPPAPASPPDLLQRIATLEAKFDRSDPTVFRRTFRRGIARILEKSQRIRPGFSASWVVPEPPDGGEKVMEYAVGDSRVALYLLPDGTECVYHLIPAEYLLPVEQVALIDLARAELLEHIPGSIQFTRPEQARRYVVKEGVKVLMRLSEKYRVSLGTGRREHMDGVRKLSEILARYTAGLGVAEHFLSDPYVQDIYVDAPPSDNLVHITVGGLGDPRIPGKCTTNVCITSAEAESMLSRFRYESGRPFSEARPYLEMDLHAFNTRVTVIGKPLSPDGIAIAMRRHSSDPWTLLKLVRARSLNPLAAGLLSFLIDGQSTLLVAGSRGAGKSSLLGALMLEFPQNQRILTIEDTLELPAAAMQRLGYKVQSMHVQSSLGGMGEMTADEALRISLRLGESAIVLGEVRGQEARTLYEAMRTGTAGSSVMGTIHGNSPRAVYERVVHDMGIAEKAFTATDLVVIAGLRRPAGTQKNLRRVTHITEVLKGGAEAGFNDLMVYDEKADGLAPAPGFEKSERIGAIAQSWGLTRAEAAANISMRAKVREEMVTMAVQRDNPALLSARWTAAANGALWSILERRGKDYGKALEEWRVWFAKQVRYG